MTKQAHAYGPTMSDAAVKAKTGKDWKGWFAALDKSKAQTLGHKAIAQHLVKEHGVPGWWSQAITVEYERARGLRERYETANGFSVGASKTIDASVSDVFEAVETAAARKKWFPRGTFKASSQTKDKYLNGSWNESARLNIGFYAKGAAKSQIAVQVSKLDSKAAVDSERVAWKAALEKLKTMLES